MEKNCCDEQNPKKAPKTPASLYLSEKPLPMRLDENVVG